MTKPPCGGLSLQEHHDELSMKNQGVSGRTMVGRAYGDVKLSHQTLASARDAVPVQFKAGEVFFETVGVVGLGFGFARDGVQFAAGVG
jgi:hypothetical protein